jgi:hypothetical protein
MAMPSVVMPIVVAVSLLFEIIVMPNVIMLNVAIPRVMATILLLIENRRKNKRL